MNIHAFKAENIVLTLVVGVLFIALFAALPYLGMGDSANAQVQATSSQTIQLTVQETITLNLANATVTVGTLTPGSPIASSTSVTVDTNGANGWELRVARDSGTSTIASGATAFPDATEWDASPNSQDTTAVGSNLHFKVANTGTDAALYDSSWWGPNDTDGAGNALYAGFPTSSLVVASTTNYVGATQNVALRYRADSPATQKAGTYSGSITLTAITKP